MHYMKLAGNIVAICNFHPQNLFVRIFFPAIILIACLGISANNKNSFENKGDLSEELFSNNEVLNIKLSGELRDLFNDRSDNPKYHAITISYTSSDGKII